MSSCSSAVSLDFCEIRFVTHGLEGIFCKRGELLIAWRRTEWWRGGGCVLEVAGAASLSSTHEHVARHPNLPMGRAGELPWGG